MALQRDHICFAVLLLCVPFQYFVVNYMESTETARNYGISKMVSQIRDIRFRWFRVEPWKRWCHSLLLKITEGSLSSPAADEDMGESPAFEVLKFREKDGYFAQSAGVRDTKPPNVVYRIGQVVKHKKWGYRGVITGWDEQARAPKEWIASMHKENPGWTTQPNYAMLVDTRDRAAPQITYVPQENIEVIRSTKIVHPQVEDYFEHFDGSQYIPRPWLKGIYPRD